MKKSLLILAVFFSFVASAQDMKIKVNVVDTNAQIVIPNAVGIVKRVRDSVLLDFRRSDKYGNMSFSLPIDTIEFTVIHPDYGVFRSFFFGSKDNNELILEPLAMPEKATNLDEVLIYANRNPIYYRGDTLVYVADSFKVKENAVVEDLIRKLPGMTIDASGKITNQGKEISKVLVDGDEFFGSDPTIATKNLAAKGVDKVEVYEKDAEDGSDEKLQILDLKLKDEAKKGYFGKVNLAGGLDKFTPTNHGFYEGEALFNKFNNKQKISFYVLGSNTPKTDLSFGDMRKFGLAEGRDWMAESDDIQSFQGSGNNDNEGIPNAFRAGVYYDQKIGKKVRLLTNYSFSQYGVKTQTSSRSQYLLSDTSYTTDLNSLTKENYQQHTVGMKLTYKIDSLSRLEIEPKFQFNNSTSNTNSITNFISQRDTTTRSTTTLNNSDSKNSSLSGSIRYYKDFMKKNRKLFARYYFSGTDLKGNGALFTGDTNALTHTQNFSFDQHKESRSNTASHTAYVDYFEPLGKRFKLEFDYEFNYNNNAQRKTSLNPISGEYVDIDSVNSNQFKSNRQQHRAGAFLIYENTKLRISVGTRIRNIDIANRNIFTDSTINQNLINLLPRAVFRYKFNQTTRLMVQYNTNSALPSLDQLQPVLNNTNPNFIQIGNSNLKPNYTHTVNANFNTWKGLSGFYMYSGLSYTRTLNAFSTNTIFNPMGGTISQAINVDHSDYLFYWAGAGIPIKGVKDLQIRVNANGNFTSSENQINFMKNKTNNTGIGSDLTLSYNGDSLRVDLGGGFDYNVPKNSLTTSSNQPYTSYNIRAEIDWTLPFKFFFKTDATYNINTGRTAGYNTNFIVWNMSIQRAFMKTGNLLFGIEAYDILNQNISNYRTMNNNVIVDEKINIIKRYFMAKLTWRFNNNKTKESDYDGWY
ncbi:MAG TPA: outer membrane beta-barrel protein [Fluviicola sp.]|nr:outer membrane beta-barrel protein [Fluviicola sp.]